MSAAAGATKALRMPVVYSSHDLGERVSTDPCNKPQERKSLILNKLQSLPALMHLVDTPDKGAWDLAKHVHDAGLVDFLRVAWDEWAAMCDFRDPGFYADHGDHAIPAFVPFQVAPRDGLQRAGKSILSRITWYGSDRVTPIYASVATAIEHDLGVVSKAVDLSLDPETKLSYALITHPGHHANRDQYGGYCFVNSAAVAARLLQQRGGLKKVSIIDIDYHAGNGTVSIFYNDPSVFVCSIHIDPEADYPFTSGYADQTGGPDAPNATLNIPLPPRASFDSHYHKALSQAMHASHAFDAEALVVSMGLDTYAEDPVAAPGAGFKIELPDYEKIGRMLGEHAGPIVVVQEGGYYLPAVAECAAGVLQGIVRHRQG